MRALSCASVRDYTPERAGQPPGVSAEVPAMLRSGGSCSRKTRRRARAPEGADSATAGAAPLAGITAMLAVDALELSDRDTVLIVGATGGVGSLAVQIA